MTAFRAALAALALSLIAGPALAQSTINPNVPLTQSDLTSLTMRQQFQRAASDVNGLLGMHPTASLGGCPATTYTGIDCLVTGVSPAVWYKSYQGGYGVIGTFNTSTGQFSPVLTPLSVAATPPLGVTFSGGVATLGLNYNSSLVIDGSNNLGLNLMHSNIWTPVQTFGGGIAAGSSGVLNLYDYFGYPMVQIAGPQPTGATGSTIVQILGDTCWVGDEDFTVTGTPTTGEQPGWSYKVGGTTITVQYTVQAGDTNSNIAAGLVAAARANSSFVSLISGACPNGVVLNAGPSIVQLGSSASGGFDVVWTAAPTLSGNAWTPVNSTHTTITVAPNGKLSTVAGFTEYANVVGRTSIVGDVPFQNSLVYPDSAGNPQNYWQETFVATNVTPGSQTFSKTWTTGTCGYLFAPQATISAIEANGSCDLALTTTVANRNVTINSSGTGLIQLTPGSGGIVLNGTVYGGSTAGQQFTFQTTSNGSPSGDAFQFFGDAYGFAIPGAGANLVRFLLNGSIAQIYFGAAGTYQGEIILGSPTANALTLVGAASATGTVTFPSGTYTLAGLSLPQTWLALQTFNTGDLVINGGSATAGIATVTGSGVVSSEAVVPVGNGGTNCSIASITCFNNITGFSVVGTTGTTSTNLVFSTSPTITSLTVLTGFTATGLVTNADLANSTISNVALGGSLAVLSYGTHLTNSAGGSSYNGSAASTLATDATNANTASTIVARDGSGNFSAGTITASLTGHASLDLALTGGTLTGALTVSGASFGLSGNISAPAWTTAGVRYANVTGTLTDTTSSGTVATAYSDVFGGNTIATTSAVTYTNYVSAYFKDPVQGTNVTFANNYALGADSILAGGGAGDHIFFNSGLSTSATGDAFVHIGGTVTASAQVNSAFNIDVTLTGTAGGAGNSMIGARFIPTFTPTASITDARAVAFQATYNPGTGATITNADDLQLNFVSGSGAGAITNANLLHVNVVALGSIKPTTLYGVHVENVGVSGITTSYGIFVAAQSGSTTNHGIVDNADLLLPNITNVATTSAVCVNTGTGLFSYDGTLGTCTVSDERLKNIGPRVANALEKVLQISGFYFTFKDPDTYGRGEQIGVGAQTVEKVFPELVSTDSEGHKSVAYDKLAAPIIEALRELKADNDNLRAELHRSAAGSR